MYIQHPFHPAGYRQIQLTEFVSNIIPPLDAVRVTIQPTGQDIRFRDDSIDPSVSVGMHIAKDSTFILDSDTKSLRLITEANTTAPQVATANLASGPVNSDINFASVDTGPEWNGYDFEIVEDAVVGVNSTAVLDSAAVNSDVTFTADTQDSGRDGVVFTIVLDATVGANASGVLLSAAVNSDLTFTAVEKEDQWNDYNFTTVADANAGANASATLASVAVNSDLTFTAVEKEDQWNDYNFTTVADANAGANASATLASVAVNADITFTSATKDDSWNGYSFETVDDVVAGVNADATLNINAANGDLVFTAPATGAAYNGTNFTANSAGAESITYSANSFVLNYNAATSNGATMKTAFDAALGANPGWPQWTCADEGDGSGVWDAVDDEETIASANGVTEQIVEVTYATNTFTIHIDGGVTNASQVETAWGVGPAECANWAIAVDGDGSGAVDVETDTAAGGIDPINPYIEFAVNTFTIHILGTTIASEVVALWAGGPANCANFAIADEGDGSGVVDATTIASAGGVDVVDPYIDFAVNTFTIHILGTTIASDVVTLWGGGPANCANFAIADEGDGSGVVDATTVASAGGVDVVDPYIDFAVNTFTIHILTTTIASEVVTLWGAVGAPANCANFAIVAEGDGSGVVDATTVASAGGIDILVPYINYAANTFTIHAYAAAIGSDIVTLWAGGPAECANWAIVDEGDGSGAVQAVTDTSANGATPIATSIDFAANTFTIHTYPAVTTANDVVVLWAGGPADCADWTCTEEGDGSGVVAAATDTSANGADAVGAVVNLLWHKEL
jgi:hypothetical protein